MKTKLKTTYLLWLSLLAWTLWAFSLNSVSAVGTTNIDVDQVNGATNTHRARVYSLFLWDWNCNNPDGCKNLQDWTGSWLGMIETEWTYRFEILDWLFVSSLSWSSSSGSLVVVWWWSGNKILGDNSWIGGWQLNSIEGSNSAIGGWFNNKAWNNSIVAWWKDNQADNWWVVAWWYNSKAKHPWTIIFWNDGETYWSNAMLLSTTPRGGTGSFVWGQVQGDVPVNFAKIRSSKWILIWTYKPIDKLSLVVSGAIKVGNDLNVGKIKGEILVDGWCIYTYNRESWQRNAIGRTSRQSWSCDTGRTCVFGKTLLQDGEKVRAYNTSFAKSCGGWIEVTCNNWTLSPAGYVYPYCYSLWNNSVL